MRTELHSLVSLGQPGSAKGPLKVLSCQGGRLASRLEPTNDCSISSGSITKSFQARLTRYWGEIREVGEKRWRWI